MFVRLLLLGMGIFLTFDVWAEDIKLDAEQRVEYHQKEQKLVAIGNAVATKGKMSIKANELVGYYAANNKNKISRVEAHGNVVMKSDQTEAFGNDMVYDVKDDMAKFSGRPARIKTADADISSQGPIIFWPEKQEAVAEEEVVAIDKQGNKVRSDKMHAYFVKGADGKLVLDKIDIDGDVKINAKEAEISSRSGVYYANDNKVELFDDVVITQNGNVLHGDKAESNFNSGISKILSGNKGRVSGVFKENKKKKESK